MDLGELFDYLDWPGARQVGKLERTAHHKGRTHRQVRYFVTSLPAPDPHWEIEGAGPAQLSQLIRGHWAIENRLHYVRDVSCATPSSAYSETPAGPTSRLLSATTPGALSAALQLLGITSV